MYSRWTNSWLKHWDFILVDLLSLEISFLLAYLIRHGFSNPFVETIYRGEAFVLLIAQLLAVFSLKAFSGVLKRGYYIEFLATCKHVLMVMAVTLAVLFATKETETYSRLVLGITGVIYVFISYIARIVLKHYVRKNVHEKQSNSLVVVTSEEMAPSSISYL